MYFVVISSSYPLTNPNCYIITSITMAKHWLILECLRSRDRCTIPSTAPINCRSVVPSGAWAPCRGMSPPSESWTVKPCSLAHLFIAVRYSNWVVRNRLLRVSCSFGNHWFAAHVVFVLPSGNVAVECVGECSSCIHFVLEASSSQLVNFVQSNGVVYLCRWLRSLPLSFQCCIERLCVDWC